MHDNPYGDDRYFSNLFVELVDLSPYDGAPLPVKMDGNVFLKGAKPSKFEKAPLVEPSYEPALKLVETPEGFFLEISFGKAWTERPRKLLTTESLGRAAIPNLPYERADGTPLRIDTDYFGRSRNASNPTPGPFENPGSGMLRLKLR
jgi:alpha-N-arabinofuranosidase